ncbi:hypothetical protein [Enterovirga rhinocerotis]|uniref:IPT/TIG domain-containing protein n=1 Tax=Enterovirga rhinocerotis TaxID=1339210 RepID=A0A4R7C608_9HYPH|nr:hypothetical protein [Enterovirga rhinocerotis]TDR94000.1 hypothetical protein EV668_1269 [Enterovirga rhinocerotis]
MTTSRAFRPRVLVPACCALAAVTLLAAPARSAPPKQVGTCDRTTIKLIGTRFEEGLVKPKPGSIDQGTSVILTNGVVGISYAFVPAVAASKVGDSVMTCLISVPKGCPKGDERGRVYTTTNLRTQDSWTLPDAQHMCGGA